MRIFLGTVVTVAAVLTVACDVHTLESGPDQTEEVSFNPTGVEAATVELHLGAGELDVHGGAAKLAQGDLEYNIPSLKPVIHQTTAGHFARLRIDQPESHGIPHNMKYHWNLQLSDSVPISLNVNCGAGQARLTVGELHLREVEVHIGAGQIDLDLRGAVHGAADQCAEQLRDRGYAITAADVIGALEEALEGSEVLPKPRELLN